jgi:prepilin-type N-terminal cleavage/methylation domain-containing protein
MKKGFTLIELLIVTVVIATLMGIVFRLAGAGGGSRALAATQSRLQRIENALSGYYAAFGSYPPVPLQGRSRSIYTRVDENGVQGRPGDTGEQGSLASDSPQLHKQIKAACRAQPVTVLFPFYAFDTSGTRKQDADDLVDGLSALCQGNNQLSGGRRSGFSPLSNIGSLDLDKSDWQDVNLFQFGLLSFLLPRYLFMLEGDTLLYDHRKQGTAKLIGQWASNNQLPCRLDTGDQFEDWETVQEALYKSGALGGSLISNLASQAVCARWMPNFEGIISGGRVFYGVNTADEDRPYLDANENLGVFSHGGYDSSSDLYILDGMTIEDGWGEPFYYYSAPPYQSYRLWSSGPDKKTFPPWYDLSALNTADRTAVANWTKDDVEGLKND